MKTSAIRKHEPSWHHLDANGKVLGRLATEIVTLLRGKDKVEFSNHLDCGDHVVVTNAAGIVLTGRKLETKAYHHYSGYPGGMKTKLAKQLMVESPSEIIVRAVKGMLPKNKLQTEWLKRLHVYADENHPHQANTANLPVK
ncbi:50S ribosomal protein L13 [Patescibacteria group bacterium]|nr:50S ribosomal protein L13 [Patescibacteria group bacterium]